jgi:hypothetical protein
MGLDIIIHREQCDDIMGTTIYHATFAATDHFRAQSPAFKALTDFAYASNKDKVMVAPAEYSPLIRLFSEEKAALEAIGNTPRGRPDHNEISLYDCIEGCYNGLMNASGQNKDIEIF